ncbi:hypothetical protein [Streptomyces olivochromogenes]|uniref:hypothetical protein n=1 Tax=Streptomyces olivochromogenes TaxID=1963 RepID=UPI001F225CF7|nr:hypothetical protein [Streptomyces olivochromogenes]MCF3136072.1 hypothetical protein [Streptomyces olivochromogenes]
MKRTATLAASALFVLPLTALTGCGGSDKSEADNKPDVSATPARAVSPAQQVQQQMLTGTEAAGYGMSKLRPDYLLAKTQKELTVDKATCLPLGYAMNQLPIGSPQAHLTRVAAKKEPDGILTYITLSSYAHGQAQATMAGLSTAVKSCASGFAAKGPGGKNPYKTVRPETAPTGGDEALAFAATFDAGGQTQTVRTQVFRFHDTVVTYFAIDSQAFLKQSAGNARIPSAVVKAQNAKLG